LRDSLGATVVVITHELASILAIRNNSVLLDADTKPMIAAGVSRKLLAESKDSEVINFLTRGVGRAEKAERLTSMDRGGKQ
jgi:phospholipid/cholesterol/gamma-HCH transport system ATP-binding protein